MSYAVEQQLTDDEKARALENLGLDKALTPFGFTAAAGQTAFDLGMSPLAECLHRVAERLLADRGRRPT